MCWRCQRESQSIGMLLYEECGGFGLFGGEYDGDGVNRSNFASVSQRAMNALKDHLATVDTSNGAVTTEIIKFHLVPDMRKQFNKFVKEHGCIARSRQITRQEQDLINKSRKSLLHFTSVRVTPEAQRAYLEKHPHVAKPTGAAHVESASHASAASGSTCSTSASTSSTAPAKDVAHKKLKRKLNEAAVNYASSNPSIKMLNAVNKKA